MFPLASVSRPALRPNQSPMQWVPGSFPGSKERTGRDTDHPHLLLMSRMSRSHFSSPPSRLHSVARRLYLLSNCTVYLYLRTILILYLDIYSRLNFRQNVCVPLPPCRHQEKRRYSSYSFLTSALYGGELSASRPGRVLPPVPSG
jgi:hypothetical protein